MALKEMTASAFKAFEAGNFAAITHGLGAKYGKKAAHLNTENRELGLATNDPDDPLPVDKGETSPKDAVETSFLSDEACKRGLDSSVLRGPSEVTTPASSIERAKETVEQASYAHAVNVSSSTQKFAVNIVWHPGESVELQLTSLVLSQKKAEYDAQKGNPKELPAIPKMEMPNKKQKDKAKAKEKKSYASVLQQGTAIQTKRFIPNAVEPLECPPDLIYASYGATLRLEQRKQTIKRLGLCDESLAALADQGSPPAIDECRVHQIFDKKLEEKSKAQPNLLSGGCAPRPKKQALKATEDQDVEAVLASQWNSDLRKISAIHRAVTEMVDEELAQGDNLRGTKMPKMSTIHSTQNATAAKNEKVAAENSGAGRSTKQLKPKKDQSVPATKPESMRASDGGSWIQCVGASEQAKSNETESGINPLQDIKKWSVKYFQKYDPLVAERTAAFVALNKPDSSMHDSGSDTRFLDDDRSFLIPVKHPNPNKGNEWLRFIGPHRDGKKYDHMPNIEMRAQLSPWDGDFSPPNMAYLESACWSVGHVAAMNVDRWIEFNVDIKNHYSVDESSSEFKSGSSRPSGLLKDRFFHPPEILFDGDLDPDFSPIDWSKNVTHPPKNRGQLSPFQALQSSELCRQITLAPYLERVAEVETIREEAHKRLGCPVGNLKADHRSNLWVPQANFYVRPARAIDIPQLIGLYNEWVKNSIFTKREIPVNEQEFVADFEQRKKNGLPFLVAATRSSRGDRGSPQMTGLLHVQQRQGRRGGRRLTLQIDRQEKIVGFVFAEPYHDTQNVFRGIIEMKVFVSPSFVRLGVGKTLLDRVMTYADPWYESKRGTRFEYNEREDDIAYKLGPTSKIRKVLIDVLYSGDQAQDFTWKKEMLETKFGFHQAGFFLNFGERDGKPINMATFVRESFNAPGNKSMMYPGQLKEIDGIFSPTAIYPGESEEV